MSIWSAISRLLAVLAVAGLVSGAFTAPGKANAMADMAATAMASADHMDCCDPLPWAPDHTDMKACPFATICTAKVQQATTTTDFSRAGLPVAIATPLLDDRAPDLLTLSPLGHPPKA